MQTVYVRAMDTRKWPHRRWEIDDGTTRIEAQGDLEGILLRLRIKYLGWQIIPQYTPRKRKQR